MDTRKFSQANRNFKNNTNFDQFGRQSHLMPNMSNSSTTLKSTKQQYTLMHKPSKSSADFNRANISKLNFLLQNFDNSQSNSMLGSANQTYESRNLAN